MEEEFKVSRWLSEMETDPASCVLSFIHASQSDKFLDGRGTDFLIKCKGVNVSMPDGSIRNAGYGLSLELQIKMRSGRLTKGDKKRNNKKDSQKRKQPFKRGVCAPRNRNLRQHYEKYPTTPAIAINNRNEKWFKRRIETIMRRMLMGKVVIPSSFQEGTKKKKL